VQQAFDHRLTAAAAGSSSAGGFDGVDRFRSRLDGGSNLALTQGIAVADQQSNYLGSGLPQASVLKVIVKITFVSG